MNIKDLKEIIKDLPDEMKVVSCCSDYPSVEVVGDYPIGRCVMVNKRYTTLIVKESVLCVGY